MASESEMNAYLDHAAKVAASVFHAVNRDGTVPALAREAIVDIRNSMHESFFGKSERGSEAGTPMHPLFHDIVDARNAHEAALSDSHAVQSTVGHVPTPGEILAEDRGGVHGQQPQGTVQGNVYGYGHATSAGQAGPEHGVHGPEHGVSVNQNLPSPGQIVSDDERGSHGQLGHGVEVAQVGPSPGPWPVPGGFLEREIQRDKAKEEGNADDGYERTRERSLPDEQRGR
jgi:hypothetical protein